MYNHRVANKGNTLSRVSREYGAAVNAVSFSIPDAEEVLVSGNLRGRSSHPMYDKENYIDRNTLELDASYDVSILGAQAGIIWLHVDLRSAKSATPANLAQILLYVRKTLDEAELPFYEIDCYFDFPSDKFPRRIVLRDYLYEDRTLEKVANAIMEADTMPGIIYGNQYERNLGTQVYSNPKITPFTCYRNIPCHQTCFYRKELFETRGYDLQFPVRADYEHFLWCYFEKKTVLVHLEEIVCSYEGAGFSETKEHLKMAKKEHHKITKMYLSIPQRIVFRSILLLTLQPLRTTIANSKRLSGIYNRVKSLIYQKKKG